VIRRPLLGEKTLGRVMLIGGKTWMIVVSLISALVKNVVDV
jgi:hypothetical protein